jgi:hypothetical protein
VAVDGVDLTGTVGLLLDVMDFKSPLLTGATAVVLTAVGAAIGFGGSGSVDALFFMVTEYTSVFFFFSSQTISDSKPSELLVVVLPASSRSVDTLSLGKSSILA